TPLIRLQKKAVRLVCGAQTSAHTEPLFRLSNIMPLKALYVYRCVLLHRKVPSLLQLEESTSQRRQMFKQMFCRTTKSQQQYKFRQLVLYIHFPSLPTSPNALGLMHYILSALTEMT